MWFKFFVVTVFVATTPTLVMKDSRTKMVVGKVVTSSGIVDYVVAVVRRMIEQLGYEKVILKSGYEPAIQALKEAVRRECDPSAEGGRAPEESPLGDHQANGLAENAVRNVQGQFRVKDAL